MNKHISILAVIFMLLSIKLTAQVYPVATRTSVTPPYPYSLSGFVDDMANKVNLNIDVNDVTLSNYPVKLRMVLRSNAVTLITSASYITEPIYINGAEPLLLNSSDLANYFRTENIDFSGYSKAQYMRTGQLPDGVYQLSFQVIDAARNINISSTFPAFIYVYVNDPPILNLPLNKKKIDFSPTQNIGFNWTFRHSPFSRPGFNPCYVFELWEVYPDFLDPYQVVRSAQPIYTEELNGNSVNYSIMHPLLLSGRTYAWRVRVIDPDGITAFKDDGFSEVYWFKYGINCMPPTLEVESVGPEHINVAWETEQLQSNFTVRYRPTNQQEEKWYSANTTFLNKEIEPLRPNTEYIVEVQGQCGDQPSGYSESVTATTEMDLDYQCGETGDMPEIENQERLTQLIKGTHITAGDFDVEIFSVEGSNGTFNGKGFVLVPLFNFLKLEADLVDIVVNTDYQLIGGEIKTVYNLDNSLALNLSDYLGSNDGPIDEVNDFEEIADIKVDANDSITSVYVTENTVQINTASGSPITENIEPGKLVAITAPSGAQYVVDGSTNTVYAQSNPGGSAPSNNSSTLKKEPDSGAKYKVSFQADPNQLYGFDAPADDRPTAYFNTLDVGTSQELKSWKSIEAGRFDKVVAKITGTPTDSVYFSRESGSMVMIAPTVNDDTKQLMIAGQGHEDTDELYAWYNKVTTDSIKPVQEQHAASLDLVSYEKQTIELCLVGINGSVVPEPGYIQDYLNSIYKQAVVQWQVSKLEGGITVELPHDNEKLIDNTDADNRMDYTSDMKLAINALKELEAYDKKTIYLFMADAATDENIKGYMPLKSQFGFIFKFKSYPDSYSRTIAHELSHGAFRLRHTFSDENTYKQDQGSTQNLLDYSGANATELFKYQWDLVHDPENMLFSWLEEESEGESKSIIISNAYTDLFNYMYKHYMDNEKLDIPDMSRYDGEGDYKNWTLNKDGLNPATEIGHKATNILDQIRNTATNSQIPDLILTEKQILPSIVSFNKKSIPIVIYSPASKVGGITKSWFSDVEAFNNSKFYYCEERWSDDYIVLALYTNQEDYPLTPSLILQMEDDETNLKEKWLRDLLILEPKKPDVTPLSDSDLKMLFPSLANSDQETLDDRKNYWAYVSTNMKTLFAKCKKENVKLDYYNNRLVSPSSHNNTGKQMFIGLRKGKKDFTYYDKIYINIGFEVNGTMYDAAAHNFGGMKTYNAAKRPIIKSIEDLSNAKMVKSITTPNYVLIALYEKEGNDPFIVYQVNGTEGGILESWLNYFHMVENEEKVEDLIETIIDAHDEDYKGIVHLEKKLTNESVFAREFEIEDKKFDVYIERSGKVEDDKSKIYLFITEEKTKILGFDGEFTSFILTNYSGGKTKLSVPTEQAKDFATLVLNPELGHAANIRAICERIRQAGVHQETSVDFSAFGAVQADKFDLWNAVPNVKLGETVFDFRSYQVYNESNMNIVFANLVEKTDNPNILEKYGYRLEFKNKDRKTVVSLNIKREQFDELKEYIIPSKPLPGDPLINMAIVHNYTAPNSGGMFGCARDGIGCEKSVIPNLPKYSRMKKVHGGVDVKANIGDEVFSMFDGTVIVCINSVPANQLGSEGDFGNRVLIKSISGQHNFGNKTIFVYYTHLNGVEEGVKNGEKIKQGQKIGIAGKTGNAYDIPTWRDHVHICVYENATGGTNKVNPIDYFTTKFDSNGNIIE